MAPHTATIIGGCGFLGSYVSARLVAEGFQVRSVHRSVAHTTAPVGVTCITADYRDARSIDLLLRGSQVLIHLGSQSVPRTSLELGVPGVLEEVDANARLFDLAAKAGVSKVVFASSGGSVYGQCEPGVLIHERHSCEPISPHGLLKVMTELALGHVSLVSGQSATSLRMGNIYGLGQETRPRFAVIPTFLRNLRTGQRSEVWGPESVRDYIHVSDAAEAFVAAALTERPLPRAINVGTGTGHSAVEIYSMLQSLTGISQPIDIVPRPASDPAWNVLSIDLMQEHLQVSPQVAVEEGLESLIVGTAVD